MTAEFEDWTFVFDLDGTLVETAPDLHAALNHTLATKALAPVSVETIRMMIGDGAKAMIRKGLNHHGKDIDEDEIDQSLWPIFLDHYRENSTRLSRPFDACTETLASLLDKGATLAVCTNKPQSLAELVLSGLNMDHYFSATVGGDLIATKKPAGEHIHETLRRSGGNSDRAIMVGDAWTDEKAARNAGLPFVFVTFGYGSFSDRPYDRYKIIDHWREMEPALLQLIQSA